MDLQEIKTQRGFDRVEFTDHYGTQCSLQKSSLASEDAIWFGCNDANPKILHPGRGWQPFAFPNGVQMTTRMHLTQEQVKELLPYLQRFVETGKLM